MTYIVRQVHVDAVAQILLMVRSARMGQLHAAGAATEKLKKKKSPA